MPLCLVGLIAMLLCMPVGSAAEVYPLPQARIHQLMASLLGHWDGEAVETPVGPVDYDISFRVCNDGSHVGVAETGASLHYWRFFEIKKALRVRFMSTFAGNRESTLLLPGGTDDDSIRLFAPAKEILTLRISPTAVKIDIHIFHWGKPHVHIVLNRTAPESARESMRDDLCEKLPASLLQP